MTWCLLGFCLVVSTGLNAQKQQPQKFGQSAFYQQIEEKAQENNGKVRCASYEYDQYLNSVNPKKETINEFESWFAPKIEAYKQKNSIKKTTDGTNIITIPVVVHIIHDNKAYGVDENITDEQILSQITVLNQDFRKMLGTPGHNTNPVGADTEVEFCMAQRTPDGQATNGINRLNIPTPVLDLGPWGQFITWTMEDIEDVLKPTTVWDSSEYLNVWVVDEILLGMVAGYAQFPVSSGLDGLDGGSLNEGAETDGIVVAHYAFGSSDIYPTGIYEAPYDKGRTTTHEVGHWLGLRHIWGDNNSCSVDATDSFNDFCLDTPPANDQNEGCTQTSTCSAPSMIENYMDYTNDSCQNIFTEDQKTRIRTALENAPRRVSLLTSSGCLAPQEFDAKVGIIDLGCDTEASPIILLSNIGTATVITSAEISYGIEGETPQTYNWTGMLNPHTDIQITLPIVEFEQESNFIVTLISINGTVDDNTLNNSSTALKTISSVYTSSALTLSLTTDDYGDETSWRLIDNSTGMTVIQGGGYSNNQTYSVSEELPDGCYTFTIYDEFGDGICCDYGQGSYTITSGSEVIVSGGAFGSSESTTFGINTTANVDSYNSFEKITLYPNPTNSILNINVTGTTELPENIFIYNTLGQIVKNLKVNSSSDLSVDVNALSNGIYLIKVTGQNQSKTLRFIKQ